MLIFLICINILTLSFFLIWYGAEKNNYEIKSGGFILSVIMVFILFILICALICSGANSREDAKQLTIDHANLTYYIHHLEDYKERTVVESINEYNVKLKDFRAKQSSPWLNWFYPGDISECEYIIWVDRNGK